MERPFDYRWQHLGIIAFCIFFCALAISFLVYYCRCMIKQPSPAEMREHMERLYCADLSSSTMYGGCTSGFPISDDRKTTTTSLAVPSIANKSFIASNLASSRVGDDKEAGNT